MANCPNCGRTLHFTDWKQDCPGCGVNLIYFGSNERLLEESEQAEIEHAKHQPSIDRAKAAFFGSWPAILRLILHVLPIGALFLPLLSKRLPEGRQAMNVIDLYKNLPEGGFGGLVGGALRGDPALLAVLLLFFSAAMILVCLVCLVMSLGKHGKQRNLILNLILLGAAGAGILLWVIGGGAPAFGAWIYLLLLAVILVYNLYLAKKGLKIKHTVCYIGGLPSEEYFGYIEQGMSDLEIRKKMVEALTAMQEEVREKERLAAIEEEERRKAMK
ncbi:MAG: hypothetical protein IK080_02805 [Clostridia bacterium]|nr:hypothetical protein [Clostridia bacterium]